MTTAATGTPDWQIFATLHSTALLDVNTVINAGVTTTLGQWDSSSYHAVHLSVQGNLNGGTLTVTSGETASNVPDDICGRWVIRPTTLLNVTIPLTRNKLSIVGTAQGAANWDFTIRAALSNVAVDKHHYYGNGHTVAANNIGIGAGVTQSYDPSSLLPGPAHIWAVNTIPANVLNFDIVQVNSDGTNGLYVAQYRQIAGELNQSLILPTNLYRVNVFNAGAGAGNYYFSLISQGLQT